MNLDGANSRHDAMAAIRPQRPAPGSGARWGDILFDWVTRKRVPELPAVQEQLLRTLPDNASVTALVVGWSFVLPGFGILQSGAAWGPALLTALAVLNLLMVCLQVAHGRALQARTRPPRRALLAVRVAWFAVLALSVFLSFTERSLAQAALASGLAMSFNGYISSRFAAFPRLATALLVMVGGAFAAGLLVSSLDGLPALSWLVPPAVVASYFLMRLQHDTLLAAVRAQQENLRLARHDALTGLPNRLALDQELTALCERLPPAHAHGTPFAVLALDLDGFKHINDAHGHASGDQLLQGVAERLRATIRLADMAARTGGDEFVVLLPGADAGAAAETSRRLIDAVHQPMLLNGDLLVRPRVSVGVALAPQDGRSQSTLLNAADQALYAAKKAGKGRWAAASLEATAI